jgi:hypothetical protein
MMSIKAYSAKIAHAMLFQWACSTKKSTLPTADVFLYRAFAPPGNLTMIHRP